MGTAYRSDPILALIEPDEIPFAFLALPDADQRWRGRLFLAILWGTHHAQYSWWIAMGDDEETTVGFRRTMEETPDELFLTRAHALRAEMTLESGEGLVRA